MSKPLTRAEFAKVQDLTARGMYVPPHLVKRLLDMAEEHVIEASDLSLVEVSILDLLEAKPARVSDMNTILSLKTDGLIDGVTLIDGLKSLRQRRAVESRHNGKVGPGRFVYHLTPVGVELLSRDRQEVAG